MTCPKLNLFSQSSYTLLEQQELQSSNKVAENDDKALQVMEEARDAIVTTHSITQEQLDQIRSDKLRQNFKSEIRAKICTISNCRGDALKSAALTLVLGICTIGSVVAAPYTIALSLIPILPLFALTFLYFMRALIQLFDDRAYTETAMRLYDAYIAAHPEADPKQVIEAVWNDLKPEVEKREKLKQEHLY